MKRNSRAHSSISFSSTGIRYIAGGGVISSSEMCIITGLYFRNTPVCVFDGVVDEMFWHGGVEGVFNVDCIFGSVLLWGMLLSNDVFSFLFKW